jgi:hypothetical protein
MRNDEGVALGWHVRPLRGKGAGERLRPAFYREKTLLSELTRMSRLFLRLLVGGCKGGCRWHLPRTTSPAGFC